MTKLLNKTSNLAAPFLVVGMLVLGLMAVPAPVSAQTNAQLQAQIQALLVQIQLLQAQLSGSANVSYSFTRDLTIGSRGADVAALQNFLISQHKGPAATQLANVFASGVVKGYFGPLTRSAVAEWQFAMGIQPAVGYFGPITRARIAALVVVPPIIVPPPGDDDDDTGPLEGGAGTVDSYKLMSTLSNEEVGEDEEDAKIAGLTVEVDDNSDIRLTAVKLNFDVGTAASDFDKYAEDVSVWLDGEEVGRADADEFDDDNGFQSTISLDDAVIRAGDTGELVVAVTGISNLDSTDATDTWTVDFTSVRFVDGQGASTSEDPSTGTRTFSFETFATAQDSELKIKAEDDAINDAHIIEVNATQKTTGVELASFTLEAEGDSDLEIKKFGVNIDVTGATDMDQVFSGTTAPAIWLEIDGERYGTATYGGVDGAVYAVDVDGTYGADQNVLFDDIDYTIDAGDTVSVVVVADLLAISGDLDEGDTIAVSVDETETDLPSYVDVRDETGEKLADADITGTVSAGASATHAVGINLALVSADATVLSDGAGASDDDIVTFTMIFDITAFGGSVYVGDTSAATTVASSALGTATPDAIFYRVYDDGTATTDDLADLITFTTPSGVTDSGDNILLTEDSTSRVTLTVTQTNNTAEDNGIYYMDLAGVRWGIADDTTYEYAHVYNLDDFKTKTVTAD